MGQCDERGHNKYASRLVERWNRKEEWCTSFSCSGEEAGDVTNNFCESAFRYIHCCVQFFYYDMYRVMQDIIRERRSCRNVFEVLDFICIDYELYMKARLVNLATGRSQYRNAFGLQVKEIQHGISDICRVGESAVFVMMQMAFFCSLKILEMFFCVVQL